MDGFSDNIQHYKLGNIVEGNLMDCEIQLEHSTSIRKVSALKYEYFGDAETLYNMLYDINSSWLTKPHGIRRWGENQEGGVVFVEKVYPFSIWLRNNNKLGMWKIFGNAGECIGIGDDFKKKFKQIILGLEAIHKSKQRHGNLSGGVFLGEDQNIRLSNFLFMAVTDQTLKEDFKEYQKLVEKAISLHGPPQAIPGVPFQVREVQEFCNLFRYFTTLATFQDKDAFWLYKTPLLWESFQKTHFFNELNRVFDNDPHSSRSLFIPNVCQGGWRSKILPGSPLHDVLYYLVRDKQSPIPGALKVNDWYQHECGLVVLARNFFHHSYVLIDPFNEIELIFPGISGIMYYELLTGSYRTRHLYYPIIPKRYQVMQLIDDKIGRQSTIQNKMGILEYMKEEMRSVW